MLTKEDKALLAEKGITEQQIEGQLKSFREGFPFLKLKAAASLDNGILAPSADECKQYVNVWNSYKNNEHKICKFVPASGAASRMFKNMFEFLGAEYNTPQTAFEKDFFTHLQDFAFYDDLNDACLANEGKSAGCLVKEGNYKAVVENMLETKGLNYGQLPKGLLKFHRYKEVARTPLEEHLVEAALYAAGNGVADIHCSLSPFLLVWGCWFLTIRD